ncbi:MAG: hypothetical protein EPN70_05865 [Paraburkholderia sp.]|uniref:hypothetical protein n=1 Tax=Paraburkholderia sp. TaxID=1926495 RepID=UPI001224FBB2|nr:hypothetical protein [Paraburkholderia sp.]TAM06369.1 MAG: hypothetical protein EPN70_05865 [Paraburkholderia sp.]
MKGIKRITAGVLLATVAMSAGAGYVMDRATEAAIMDTQPPKPASACEAPNCPPIVVDESKAQQTIKWSWDDQVANPKNGKWYVRNDAARKCVATPTAKVRALDDEWEGKGAHSVRSPDEVSHMPTITIYPGAAHAVDAYAAEEDCERALKLGVQAYRRAVTEARAKEQEYWHPPGDGWNWGDAAANPTSGNWYYIDGLPHVCLPIPTDSVRDTEAYWRGKGESSMRGFSHGVPWIVIAQGGNNHMTAYVSRAACRDEIAEGF